MTVCTGYLVEAAQKTALGNLGSRPPRFCKTGQNLCMSNATQWREGGDVAVFTALRGLTAVVIPMHVV